MIKGQLLLAEFARSPWALTPDYLAICSQVLVNWALNKPVSTDTREQIEADKQARSQRTTNGKAYGQIAVIPLHGVITQRPPQDISGAGGTSAMLFARAMQQAKNDPSVSKILIEADGPGGSVYGIQEAAQVIYDARQVKPVIGIANSLAASATLWLSAQCSEFYCTPGGEVGSIGVYTAHQYVGKALENAGVEISLIQAGDFKTEGNPFEPLNDAAKAAIQARVDDYYRAFVADVARGRNVSVSVVEEKYGKGRMMGATDALNSGLIDGVKTFDELLDELRATTSTKSNAASHRRAIALAV